MSKRRQQRGRGGEEGPPVENMKEDIFAAWKVKDTLGCYLLNGKSDETSDLLLLLIREECFGLCESQWGAD